LKEICCHADHISYCIVSCLPGRHLNLAFPAAILKVADSNLNHDRLYFIYVQEFPLQTDASIVVSNSRQSRFSTFRLLPTILSFCCNHLRNKICYQQIYLCPLNYHQTNSLIGPIIMAWQRHLIFLSRGSPSARKVNCLTSNTQ